MEKIRPFIGEDLIKVFTGQRRVGKSYMLYQLMDEIRGLEGDANFIYINMELYEFKEIRTHKELYSYVKPRKSGKKNYLFIDEIQVIEGFEIAIRSILAEGGTDIYITGINADLLSGELATHLGGRYIEVRIHPLSYNEFLNFHSLSAGEDSLGKYLRYGGLPCLKNLELTDEVIFDYLHNIYQSILYRDIVSRFEVRNVQFLNNLVIYLATHAGNLISARNIEKYLKSQKIHISTALIINYLDYLNKAFFTIKISRSDIQGKRIFETGGKHYFNDLGIRNAIAGFRPPDMGILVENAVFNHLNYLGYKVNVGKSGEKEVDFIAQRNNIKIYVQACYLIQDGTTFSREFGNLMSIKDQFPKYVVSMDPLVTKDSYEGIIQLGLSEFLKWE
jgi:predicted AAA+ superfamily ATPase